jgi:two-component system sensor histidine kinase YesM
VLLNILPGIFLVFVVRYRLDAVVQVQTLDIASQFMRQNAGYLELYLDEIANTVRYISDISAVQAAVYAAPYDDMYEALLAFRSVSTEISRMVAFRPEIGQLEIHGANGFSYRGYSPGFRLFREVVHRPMLAPIVEAAGDAEWVFDPLSGDLLTGRMLLDTDTGEAIGIIYAQVPLHRIENVLGRFRDGRERELLLFSREHEMVASRREVPVDVAEHLQYGSDRETMTVARAEDGFLVAGIPIGQVGLDLVMLVSAASLLSGSIGLQQFLVVTLLAYMVLTAMAWLRFSHRLTDPIQQLAHTMERFEGGNTHITAKIQSDDEVGDLARAYNRMLGRLNQLIRDVYEEQIHRRDAEWDALQAQINPHFLNNTLNSIGSLARMKGATDITRMVAALSRMFTIILYEKGHVVPLSQELEYIRLYVQIQKVRFGQRLEFESEVPEHLLDICVPKFSLQPLVENAIVHGIEPRPEGGRVLVAAELAHGETSLIIRVQDTGIGMDAKRLFEVQSGSVQQTKRIGIRNIHERIRASAGASFGLDIESQPGHGTTVTVSVPATGCPEMNA